MKEIRVHGRGGQGAVTTAQIIAVAGFYDGKKSQAFPKFGVERRGAPLEAYARIDSKNINIRSQVYNPDYVIVLDSSLLSTVDVTSGMKEGGILIINSKKPSSEIKAAGNIRVFTVKATEKANEILNRPIVNTGVLGAFAAITHEISLDSLHKAIDSEFEGEIAEKNKQVVTELYNSTTKDLLRMVK